MKGLIFLEGQASLPKWVRPFVQKRISKRELPFILINTALGISKSGRSKSDAIAIATKSLQNRGILVRHSNGLTLLGYLSEEAKLAELGQRETKARIKAFEALN